jgi:hypothetical protein
MTTREKVKAVYNSKAWRDKIDKMDEDQVVAIYMRLKIQGKVT